MTIDDIVDQLNCVAADSDFGDRFDPLVAEWVKLGVGFEAVEPILRFMEDNPDLDLGSPGGLVHFVERFYLGGYEELLVDSIKRRPTLHTAWMLNRVINGTKELALRRKYLLELQRARSFQLLDDVTLAQIERFLALRVAEL